MFETILAWPLRLVVADISFATLLTSLSDCFYLTKCFDVVLHGKGTVNRDSSLVSITVINYSSCPLETY